MNHKGPAAQAARDTVRNLVDGATAKISKNEFYAINEGGALGLPG